jgi:hypothetical protein
MKSALGFRGSCGVLVLWLLLAPWLAAAQELETVEVRYGDWGGASRALELVFSEPIDIGASRFEILSGGEGAFRRATVFARDGEAAREVLVVLPSRVGSQLLIRWHVRSREGHERSGSRKLVLE